MFRKVAFSDFCAAIARTSPKMDVANWFRNIRTIS